MPVEFNKPPDDSLQSLNKVQSDKIRNRRQTEQIEAKNRKAQAQRNTGEAKFGVDKVSGSNAQFGGARKSQRRQNESGVGADAPPKGSHFKLQVDVKINSFAKGSPGQRPQAGPQGSPAHPHSSLTHTAARSSANNRNSSFQRQSKQSGAAGQVGSISGHPRNSSKLSEDVSRHPGSLHGSVQRSESLLRDSIKSSSLGDVNSMMLSGQNLVSASAGGDNRSSTGSLAATEPTSNQEGMSSCTSLKNCCCPVCQGVYGKDESYCQEPCGPPCSEKPGCHTLREPYSLKQRLDSLDHFPNPFRLPTFSQPNWLAYAGTVLRFYAYYQEPIPESRIENYRVHQCEMRYYMEDGTIEVYEPKTFDPGFPQGRLIRRHKIGLPPPCDGTLSFYTIDHLNVGCQVEFYGKVFLICGCDSSTREFLNRKLGISVPHNFEMPLDLYTEWRKDRITSLFARRAQINVDQDKFKRFLLHSGKVLRFWAYWDNRCDGGELMRFVVHFYLEDDTVEIKQITDPKGRIRGASTFLGRGKLLKDFKELVPIPGIREEAVLILNTTGGSGPCSRPNEHVFMADRLCPGVDYKEFVKDNDLGIGAVLNVYGRAFILTSCDKATEIYYRQKYGVEDFTPLELTGSDAPRPWPRMETPPHTGIGDEEDTLHNWDRLQLEQPKKDQLVLLVKDKDILGFDAKLYNALHKVNADRRFVLKMFMVDDTIAIFEKHHPNTGIRRGMFLSRSKVRRNPNPRFELGEVSEYYLPKDFFVGNILDLNGFTFLLTSADEFTLSYMEENYHIFPQSNLCVILDKVREAFGPIESEGLLHCFSQCDECLNGVIGAPDFREKLFCLTKEALSEHEVITLQRAFRVQASAPPPDMTTLQMVIQTEMQRHHFDIHLLRRVEYTLRHFDPCRFGLVDRETLRSVLKGARLPVHKQIIDFLVDNFESADECGRVNYCCVMKYLDWVENGVPRALPSHERCVMKWLEPKPPHKIFCVNYRALLETVCPNFHCALPSVCCPTEDNCYSAPEEFPRPCSPCDCEPDPRDLAGVVISDNRIRSEEMRCRDEDQGCCPADACPYPQCVQWNSRNFEDDCGMLQAYRPPVSSDCVPAEGGRREIFRPGDFIGSDDLYGPRC